MNYIENPKTKGSGIYCAIPQTTRCPMNCSDCFFQSGRSYLEPLVDNLPNIPDKDKHHYNVIRFNDGNDSSIQQDYVMDIGSDYPMKFYNTSISTNLDKFDAPVVLTLNPGKLTDEKWNKLEIIPNNLMFVRFRVNAWNRHLAGEAIKYYSDKEVPVILTFMAYYNDEIPEKYKHWYIFRKRTLNSYYAITTNGYEIIMEPYLYNLWVYSCGKWEGEIKNGGCRHCGNCLREYFATMERIRVIK